MAVLCTNGITELQVQELEQRFSVRLPADYKQFLMAQNGLIITGEDYCNIPFAGVDDRAISFEALLGWGLQQESYDLGFINDEILDDIDFIDNALVIGSDPGGNFYLLIAQGQDAGIYYWDRTHLHADDSKQDWYFSEVAESGNIYRLYDNFSDFLNKILAIINGQA